VSDLLQTVLEAHGGRAPDGQSLDEPLFVSIDLSEIAFA
jgi:hypothetical protein